jgi:dipeptidyl aminopeptidase/acylaminoacyl peptidase
VARKHPVIALLPLALAALACSLFQAPTPTPPALTPVQVVTDTPAGPGPATATEVPSPTPGGTTQPAPTPSETAGPVETPTTAAPGAQSFVAYVRDGHLLVSDVTGGVLGGTTQYTLAGVDDGVYDLVWSPSGEYIAFTSAASGNAHVYVVFAVGQGTPLDLGPGGQPNWSPDSTRLAFVRDDNLWLWEVNATTEQPLTTQTNWAWGRPTFTPDGNALIVTGNSRDFMGVQGNTEFIPSTLPLDGSGTLTPLPGIGQPIFGRLPYDLTFSPDGQKLAFSTSNHISACATEWQYFVANPDGSDLRELYSPSLEALLVPGQEIYPVGFGYDWTPESDALLMQGVVVSCDPANPGQQLGAQLSIVDLAGQESVIVPGFFSGPTFDRGGQHFTAALTTDNATPGQVLIFNRAGELVLEVGGGDIPRFQP